MEMSKYRLPEHCPGPPALPAESSGNETSDNDLGMQLRRKDEELQQLKTEVQSYAGKLKGYQTLDQLYAESQKECVGYKQQNDELVRHLSVLMSRLSPTGGATETETETTSKRRGAGGGDDAGKNLDLAAEEGERGGEGGLSETTLSSPSFVNINSLSSADEIAQPPAHCDVIAPRAQSSGVDAAVVTDDASLSAEISQLTARLRDAGQLQHHRHQHSDTEAAVSSPQDVSSDLIRTSLSVLKLEKQTRLQKAMMEQMTVKLTELQNQLIFKNQTIAQLLEDRGRLAADVKTLKARTQYLDKLRQTESSTATGLMGGEDLDRQTAAESGDWLEVEKRVSSAGYVDIAAVSTTEVELKRRVDKLSSMIIELVSVNRSWDEYCKQLQVNHTQQVAALSAELSEVRQRLADRQKADDERQRDFDELLLSAKKQRQDEEMAKDDALGQLHTEKQLHASAEERCSELNRRISELDTQLRALQTTTNASSVQLSQSAAQQFLSVTSSVTSSPAADSDVMLELLMLREQMTVFKEDFDQERRDREASRTTIEHLDAKLREASIELAATKKKLIDTQSSLRVTKTENLQLKDRFQEVADDLKAVQRQAASRQVLPAQPRPYLQQPYVLQAPVQTSSYAASVWSCVTCTYENPAQRPTCEMCGHARDTEQLIYQRDVDIQRHVAGLHDYQAGMPLTHHERSSNLETDQSPC